MKYKNNSQTGTGDLHTNILGSLYSSLQIKIIHQTLLVRKAHLVDQNGVSRTYAVTHFHPIKLTDELSQVTEEIRQGGMIGATFYKHGYNIIKKELSTVKVVLPKELIVRMDTSNSSGTMRQYEYVVSKDGSNGIIFATITEVYSDEVSEKLSKFYPFTYTSGIKPMYDDDLKEFFKS